MAKQWRICGFPSRGSLAGEASSSVACGKINPVVVVVGVFLHALMSRGKSLPAKVVLKAGARLLRPDTTCESKESNGYGGRLWWKVPSLEEVRLYIAAAVKRSNV